MDAIKKKMQAMKLEKDNAMDRALLCEQQARDANLRAEKAEEEARALQKKIQTIENDLDQTQEQLMQVNAKLEEKDKALQNAESEVAALNRRIQLLEEDLERSEERLATATAKLAEASQAADESERARKVLENRSLADEERMDALENQLKEARFLAEEADKKYDEVARKLAMVEADLERAEERAEAGESKIVELEEELRVVGNNLKSLEVSEEKANQREEEYKNHKTLAVLGLGRIGREVAARMQAFGMKTIGFDPMVSAEDAQSFNVDKKELEEIWPVADYITIHTPLIPQTRNLINAEVLTRCKRGVRIVNVARGGIVDEAALLDALKDGRCGGAGLDVFIEEPPKNPTTLELLKHPGLVCTPHLGASTIEAQTRVAVEIAEQFVALSNPKSPYKLTGVVNAPVLSAACVPYNNRWIELTTSLGRVVGKLIQEQDRSKAKIELIRRGAALENLGFLGTAALVGLLTGRTSNGLNLINAPQLAQEAGLVVSQRYEPSEQKSVTITVSTPHGSNSVTGTIKSKTLHYLLSVNGASFSQIGTPVGTSMADWNTVQLFKGKNPRHDYLAIAEALNGKGVDIVRYSAATSAEQSESFYLVGLSSPLEGKLDVPNVDVLF